MLFSKSLQLAMYSSFPNNISTNCTSVWFKVLQSNDLPFGFHILESLPQLHGRDKLSRRSIRKPFRKQSVLRERELFRNNYIIYLLTYKRVFVLGQKTPPSRDGFSDRSNDGAP